jgi:hypothetical protein
VLRRLIPPRGLSLFKGIADLEHPILRIRPLYLDDWPEAFTTALSRIHPPALLYIQVSAGDEFHMAGDGALYGRRRRCLVWPEMTVDSDTD